MQKWEYMKIRGVEKSVTHINDQDYRKQKLALYPYLNQLGEAGWEVVGYHRDDYNGDIYVLKRPKE